MLIVRSIQMLNLLICLKDFDYCYQVLLFRKRLCARKLSCYKEYSSYGARLKTVYEAVEMCEGERKFLQIVVRADDGYRSYDYQSEVYNYYKNAYGTKGADNCSARAGFSEHQSGLTVDIEVYPLEGNNTYTNQGRYEWTMENCWYYGFINRYQEGKEHLTGYQQEEWHYRYVGKEVALFIKEHNITFDEYYTYFVKGY